MCKFINDLWVIKKDSTGAEKIWSTPKDNAALHPHFSKDGTKIMFAERVKFFNWNGNALLLKTELYTKVLSTGVVQRLTFFNDTEQQIVVSDLDWDRTGNRIVFQKADFNANPADPQIWIYSF